MAAWDNVGLPGSPQAPGYASGLADFSPIGDLAKSYYGGQEEQFKALQRKRELELQKPVTSNDPTSVISELMRRGGAPYAERLIPFLQQQQVAQPSALLGGGGGSAAPTPSGPMPAAPVGGAAPAVAPVAAPRPAPASVPSEVPGGNTLTGIAIGHYGADNGPQVAARAAKVLGLDPDTPLTPEQTQKVTAAFGSSSGRPVTPPVPVAPAAAAPASTAMPPAEYVLPNDPKTGQPFTDPKQAIVALRREGARLMANPYGKEQGKELLDWASNIEKSIGETRRVQGNFERTQGLAEKQFAEKVRLDEATLMQPVKIGSDFSGAEVYAAKDPKTGQYRRIDPKTGQVGAAVQPGEVLPSAATPPALAQPPATPAAPAAATKLSPSDAAGQKYLDENIPKEHHKTIEGLANYEINPTTFSTKGGHRERLIDAASNLAAARGESYDQKEYGSRTAAVKAFATGTQGNAVRSFDVAIDHLHTLSELAKAMHNGDVKIINAIRNKFKDQFGYDAPSNFDAAKSIVAAEITKAIVGGNSALADREELRAPLSNAKSPEQLAGVIDKVYKPLMAGQLLGLKKQYEDTTGRKNFDSRLRELTRKELVGGHGPAGGGATPAAASGAKPATVIQNGHTYDLQPDGSYK